MATAPKFRPSLTIEQLQAIEAALAQAPQSPETASALQAIRIFNFKIGAGANSPAYVPTGTAKPSLAKVEAADLLDSVDYSTLEAKRIAWANVSLAKSMGVTPSPAETTAAMAWEEYCTEHNLNLHTGKKEEL